MVRLSLLLAGVALLAVPDDGGRPIPPERFDELFALVKPQPGECKWLEIPWLTDVLEARKKAAKEGKPLMLWAGKGHPLGQT